MGIDEEYGGLTSSQIITELSELFGIRDNDSVCEELNIHEI